MSIRQFAISLDPILEDRFKKRPVRPSELFEDMVRVVADNTPKDLSKYKASDVVLSYIK